jgi:hypothetical protein
MKSVATILLILIFIFIPSIHLTAQAAGDYQTKASGNWSDNTIWQIYNGSAWQNIGAPPSGSEVITVLGTDSVFVGSAVSVTGTLVHQGIIEPVDSLTLTIADGGTLQYDRNEGTLPKCIWAEGSTLLITGVTDTAPEDRDQDYYNIIFNTPNLLSNLNMNLNNNVIGGDIAVINTGYSRWYLTTALATDTSIVTIMGDVNVEKAEDVDNSNFSVQGTSNAQTTFIIHHYGNVNITGGNFSISRGSQGGGTTTWYMHNGDFSMSNAATQNSTALQGGARFVFDSQGTQILTLGEGNDLKALPIEVRDGTTLDMGSSIIAGSGIFEVDSGATIMTSLQGGVSEIFSGLTGEEIAAQVTLKSGAGFGFNGTTAQVTSSLMPDTVGTLIINNEAGVTLSNETHILGVLRLIAGAFDNTVPFTLGPNGSISYEGGSLVMTSIPSKEEVLPTTFFVGQNYPNPFNPSTTIKFGLPSESDVSIKVFNILGKEVATLYKGRMSAGEKELNFDGSILPSGTYFYQIQADENTGIRKMLLIK